MTPGASLGLFVAGLLIQVLGYIPVLILGLCLQDQPLGRMIAFVLLLIWLFLPLFGIFGIVVGVRCYLRNIGTFLPFLGIVMNTLWLTALGIVCFYLFVVRISV
jgi:hypothetical protein